MATQNSADPPLPRYLEQMWGREQPTRRGPKPALKIEEIGEAGVRIADEAGLHAVSMKSVAEEVGLTTMSLYRYVDSKEELLAVMRDVAWGVPDLTRYAHGSWRTRARRWAWDLADRQLAHPWLALTRPAEPPLTPNTITWMEAGARALQPAGLSAQRTMSALLAIDGYVRQHVAASFAFGLGPDGVQAGQGPAAAETYGLRLATLIDAERFPGISAFQSAFSDDDEPYFETELAFGLQLLLDGIAALVERPRSRRKPAGRPS